jgi:RimJ/RimL family protein N-acetyltransferase
MTATIAVGSLELRQFRAGDEADLFAVRNHESVRRFMADPRPLDYAAHLGWVRANLLEGDRIALFVVRKHGEPVGITLLKRTSNDTAEIGVMFREAGRHTVSATHAAVATVYYAFHHLGLAQLTSYVVQAHPRAVAINSAFGGREVESDKPGMVQFRASREDCLGNANYLRVLQRIQARMRISPG